MIPSYEISCRNRFFPSQKWGLGLHTSFRIGGGVTLFEDRMDIEIRTEGLTSAMEELEHETAEN